MSETVVIDIGTQLTMVGFAGEDFPRFVWPTVVGYSSEEPPRICVGPEALESRFRKLVYPQKVGQIED